MCWGQHCSLQPWTVVGTAQHAVTTSGRLRKNPAHWRASACSERHKIGGVMEKSCAPARERKQQAQHVGSAQPKPKPQPCAPARERVQRAQHAVGAQRVVARHLELAARVAAGAARLERAQRPVRVQRVRVCGRRQRQPRHAAVCGAQPAAQGGRQRCSLKIALGWYCCMSAGSSILTETKSGVLAAHVTDKAQRSSLGRPSSPQHEADGAAGAPTCSPGMPSAGCHMAATARAAP